MPQVTVSGWRVGLQKISMTHLLQDHLGLGLQAAKASVDRVLAGESVSFVFEDLADATALAEALENVGAIVEVTNGANFHASPKGET